MNLMVNINGEDDEEAFVPDPRDKRHPAIQALDGQLTRDQIRGARKLAVTWSMIKSLSVFFIVVWIINLLISPATIPHLWAFFIIYAIATGLLKDLLESLFVKIRPKD